MTIPEFTRTAAKSTIVTVALLSTLVSAPAGHAQLSTPEPDPSAWTHYGPSHRISTDQMGYKDSFLDCSVCATTSNQELQTQYTVDIYKNAVPTNDGYDWYLVSARLNHSVNGFSGTSNWIAQGIYGESLFLQIKSTGSVLWDYGPTSSVNSTSNTFSVGGQIGSGASANFGWSQTVNTQDVSFTTTADNHQMTINTALTTPSGSDSADAAIGYQLPSAVTFKIPKGQTFQINARDGAVWDYMKPRPQVFEIYRAWNSANIVGNFTGKQLVQNTSKLCFAVEPGSFHNGQRVILATCNKFDAAQRWTYTANGQIQTSNDQYCMDGSYSSTSPGAGLVIGRCETGKHSQIFSLGQTWNYDQEAKTCDAVSAYCGYTEGVYSATSWYLQYITNGGGWDAGNVYPDEAPSSSIITNFAGNTVTSGTAVGAGTPLTFEVPGGSTNIPSLMKKAIAAATDSDTQTPPFNPTSTALALANNQFFTIQ